MTSPNDLDEIDVSERIIEEILPFKIHKKERKQIHARYSEERKL